MQQTSSSPRSQKLSKIILLFITGLVFTAAILYMGDTKIRVKTVKIEGIDKGMMLYGLDGLYDQQMFVLSEDQVAALVKGSNPRVNRVQVVKKYPDTVLLKIVLYKPAAYLAADDGYLLLSNDGRVLERVKKGNLEDLPIIHYYEKLNYTVTSPGSYVSMQDILMAIYFSDKTKALGMHVNTIDIDGVDMIGLNLDGKVVLFSSEKDKELQVYQMEQIVRKFHVDGNDFSRMDLRFNQPVLELTH